MQVQWTIFVVFFALLLETAWQDEEESKDVVFAATDEWQVVKKGQKIPKGLHVRINFETGITEAKLLDVNEKENKLSAVAVPKKPDYLEEIGKLQSNNKKKFKTYEEIKRDLKDIHLVPKTDFEVLTELLADYEDPQKDVASVLKILEDLEYLAHQYDNALEFIRQNGFQNVIYKSLNATSDEVKAQALILMGSLAQNNPKVQIHAVETGCLSKVLHLMSSKNKVIKYRIVFALGSVLRKFPWAQSKFIKTGGFSSLISCLNSGDLKLQLKIVTLLNDLIFEREELSEYDEISDRDKLIQYHKFDLKQKLVDLGYCDSLNKVFINGISSDPDGFELDGRTLVTSAMEAVGNECAEGVVVRVV